jgi:hypothetical protein
MNDDAYRRWRAAIACFAARAGNRSHRSATACLIYAQCINVIDSFSMGFDAETGAGAKPERAQLPIRGATVVSRSIGKRMREFAPGKQTGRK